MSIRPTALAQNLAKVLTKAILLTALTGALASCGFHLRGYDTPMTYAVQSTVLTIDDDTTSFPLKLLLTRQLQAVGVNVTDSMGQQLNTTDNVYTARIQVDNVHFKKYELVGVLTEVRLVLAADVTYQTLSSVDGVNGNKGVPITVKNPIQVERSYQFNEASVSVEDQQGEQVRDWLYDSLAQRITDQYVALSLPRVAPSPSTSTVPKPINPP